MGKLTYSIFKVIISHFQRSNPIVYANYSLSLFYLLDIFTIVSYAWSFALSVEESASPVLDSDGPFWAHMRGAAQQVSGIPKRKHSCVGKSESCSTKWQFIKITSSRSCSSSILYLKLLKTSFFFFYLYVEDNTFVLLPNV